MDSGEGRGDKAGADRRSVTAVFKSVSRQVQYLLDHNHLLIAEIHQNQEARLPEGLTRNVVLIRELNSNIGKVVDLYATLSSSLDAFENLQEVNSDRTSPDAPGPGGGGGGVVAAAGTQAGQP